MQEFNDVIADKATAWAPRDAVSLTPTCGTRPAEATRFNPTRWWCPNGDEPEFIDVGFAVPVYVTRIELYENTAPGAIVGVKARHPDSMEWISLWSGEPR